MRIHQTTMRGLLTLAVVLGLVGSEAWAGTAPAPPTGVMDEGTLSTPARPNWNFTGTGVTVTDDAGNNRKNITIGSDYASVTAYGAVCDGATDDDVQIQAAYTSIPAAGGAVLFPPRRCESATAIVTAGLEIPVNAAFSTATTGGACADSTTYWYRVSATNAIGETLASTQTSQATGASGGAHTVTVNWTAVPQATGYKVYCRTTGAQQLCATWNGSSWSAGSGDADTWVDTCAVTPSGALPTLGSTGKSVMTYGHGPGLSIVNFTAVTDGLVCTQDMLTKRCHIKDVAIWTTAANTQRAIEFTWPEVGSAGSSGLHMCLIQNVEVAQPFSTTTTDDDYWTTGIYLDNGWNCQIKEYVFRGSAETQADGGTITTVGPFTFKSNMKGIYLDGRSVDVLINTIKIVNSDIGIYATGSEAEGPQIVNSVIVTCRLGIALDHASPTPWMTVSSSHINCTDIDIYLRNVYQYSIVGNLLWRNTILQNNFSGITLGNAYEGMIASNYFLLAAGTGTERAVTVSQDAGLYTHKVLINGNTCQHQDAGDGCFYIVSASNTAISIRDTHTVDTDTLILDAGGTISTTVLAGLNQNKSVLGYVFADLPAVANGSYVWCSDCNPSNCTAGGSTGSWCKRQNVAWLPM